MTRLLGIVIVIIVAATPLLTLILSNCVLSTVWLIVTITVCSVYDPVTGLFLGCALVMGFLSSRYTSKNATFESYTSTITSEEDVTVEENNNVVPQRITYNNNFLGVFAYNAYDEQMFNGISPLKLDIDSQLSQEHKNNHDLLA